MTAGVLEPPDKIILVYLLKDGKYYELKPFAENDEIAPSLFPDLKFKVSRIFE